MMLPKEIEFIVYEYLVLPLWPHGQMLHIIDKQQYNVKYVRNAFIRQEYKSDFKMYMTRKLRAKIPHKIPLQCLTKVHSRVVFGTPITGFIIQTMLKNMHPSFPSTDSVVRFQGWNFNIITDCQIPYRSGLRHSSDSL